MPGAGEQVCEGLLGGAADVSGAGAGAGSGDGDALGDGDGDAVGVVGFTRGEPGGCVTGSGAPGPGSALRPPPVCALWC